MNTPERKPLISSEATNIRQRGERTAICAIFLYWVFCELKVMRGIRTTLYLSLIHIFVVDKDAGGDVHGIDQAEPLSDPALVDGLLHLGGDVHQPPPGRQVKVQLFAVGSHSALSSHFFCSRRQSSGSGVT